MSATPLICEFLNCLQSHEATLCLSIMFSMYTLHYPQKMADNIHFAAFEKHYEQFVKALPMDLMYPTLVSKGLLHDPELAEKIKAATGRQSCIFCTTATFIVNKSGQTLIYALIIVASVS